MKKLLILIALLLLTTPSQASVIVDLSGPEWTAAQNTEWFTVDYDQGVAVTIWNYSDPKHRRVKVNKPMKINDGSHLYQSIGWHERPVKLTSPTPEPGTLILLSVGLIGLIIKRKKVKR